jgi:hypothetical protein
VIKMFSFFHRTPEIHLDCFTNDPNVYLNTPIINASKTIPDWWKELPTYKPSIGRTDQRQHTILGYRTVKDCYSVIELYKKGIVLESWTDISIKPNIDYYDYYFSSGPSPDTHDKKQLGSGYPDYHHIKLASPWKFVEKTGVKFLWFGAEWSLDKLNIKILPGVLNFDIISSTNINIMFPKVANEFVIPIGQPLVHLIPLSEKKVRIKNHLVSNEEFNRMTIDSSNSSFHGWRKIVQLRKRNKERGTCPFGFGDKV